MAMMFSAGCHAMCRIFLRKSRLSTPTSPRRRRPPVYTRRVRSTARGLLLSRHASSVTPRPESRSNIRKKLLYAPVMITLRDRQTEKQRETDIKQNSTSDQIQLQTLACIQRLQSKCYVSVYSGNVTCLCCSTHTRTCQRCSHSHRVSRVYCAGTHEPEHTHSHTH